MKFIIINFVLFLTFVIAVHAQDRRMTDNEIFVFKSAVSSVSKNTHTLSTDFIQYKHLDFLSKDMESSGKMILKEPSNLLWQYKKPYNYSIIFKKGKILINNEGKKSAVNAGNSEIFEKINKMIVGSVNGNLFDDKQFSVTYTKVKNQNCAIFIPNDVAIKKYIKQIELTFDGDAMVSMVKLIESSKDYTTIVFKNKILNEKVEDSVFAD